MLQRYNESKPQPELALRQLLETPVTTVHLAHTYVELICDSAAPYLGVVQGVKAHFCKVNVHRHGLHIPCPLRGVALSNAVEQVMRGMAVTHVELAHHLRLLICQELGACMAQQKHISLPATPGGLT